MSSREILDFLSRRRRLKSAEFIELYDVTWQDTAPIKYKNPESVMHQFLETIAKQRGGPSF